MAKLRDFPCYCTAQNMRISPSSTWKPGTEIGQSLFPRLRDSPLGEGGKSRNLGKRLKPISVHILSDEFAPPALHFCSDTTHICARQRWQRLRHRPGGNPAGLRQRDHTHQREHARQEEHRQQHQTRQRGRRGTILI